MLQCLKHIVYLSSTNYLPCVQILYKTNMFIKDETTGRRSYDLCDWQKIKLKCWNIKNIIKTEIYWELHCAWYGRWNFSTIWQSNKDRRNSLVGFEANQWKGNMIYSPSVQNPLIISMSTGQREMSTCWWRIKWRNQIGGGTLWLRRWWAWWSYICIELWDLKQVH